MTRIAHVSRHLDSLIAGIIGVAPFLGRLFQTRLYHLHPCRRACAGMTGGGRQGLRL